MTRVRKLTQQNQFNNDEAALAEAIVRETVQNSTDAQAKASVPVRVRFAINEIEASNDRAFFEEIIAGLSSHLRACGMPVPASSEPLKALVVEDFGTTGLTGSVELKDNGQFSGFWRRFGRSNKQGTKGGRWGLGKLVFPSANLWLRLLFSLIAKLSRPRPDYLPYQPCEIHAAPGRSP
jgi:hypothetical protein